MKEKVILKSAHPSEYSDLEIECRVIEIEDMRSYVESIPEEDKLVATKYAKVFVRPGFEGELIDTFITTIIDGREYILSEESNVVKARAQEDGTVKNDVVVTNINSTSNEQYIVKYAKFHACYEPVIGCSCGFRDFGYTPVYEEREFARVSENVIITTSWGAKAVCLKGSYIVTYDASANDYNTIEQGAFESTYKVIRGKIKTKRGQ